MKILMVACDARAVRDWRFEKPAAELRKSGHEVTVIDETEQTPENYAVDVVVIQRSFQAQTFENMVIAQNNGVKVLYELDDWLFQLNPLNVARATYDVPTVRENIEKFLNQADGIIVSTEPLKKLVATKTKKPIWVCENSIDFDVTDKILKKKAAHKLDNKIRIGWAGSTSHIADIAVIVEPVIAILKRYPFTTFKIVGFPQFFDIVTNFRGMMDRVECINWVDSEKYLEELLDFDIGLCPLTDCDFNRAKSNIKWLEYSALKIPTIASDVAPYRYSINDGYSGYVIPKNNPKLWFKKIELLIKSSANRKALADGGYKSAYAMYNIWHNAGQWVTAFREVLNAN